MNWPKIILDGISMSLLFNAVVGVGFLLWPQAYSTMFPKEIRQAAAPYVDRHEVSFKEPLCFRRTGTRSFKSSDS